MADPYDPKAPTMVSRASARFAEASERLRENATAARNATGQIIHDGFEKATVAYEKSRETAQQTYASARAQSARALEESRRRAGLAAAESREAAARAATKAGELIDSNPLGVLAGGLVLGAIAGALLPTTSQERERIGPAARRARKAAADAARQARASGEQKLSELGLDASGLSAQARSAIAQVREAAVEVGSAARDALIKGK